MFVLLFAALKVAGQTTGYLRFDTVKIMKQNGTCELYLINKTKDSLGLLTNVGGGLTQFRKSKMLNDSVLIIGLDTLTIHGTGGGQNHANAALTANNDYTQNWAQHILKYDTTNYVEFNSYRPDPLLFAGNIYTSKFYLDSTVNGRPFSLSWALRNGANDGDSIRGVLETNESTTSILNSGDNGNQFGNWQFIGNSTNPRLTGTLVHGAESSTYSLGRVATLNPNDSIRLKLESTSATAKIMGVRAESSGLWTPVAIDIPSSTPTTASNGLIKIGNDIQIGDVLTHDTKISGGVTGYPFRIDSSASISFFSGLEYVSSGVGSFIQMSDSVMNFGASSATDFTSFTFSPTRIKFTAADGAGSSGDVWTNTGSGYGHWAASAGGGSGPPSLTYKYLAFGGIGGALSPGEAAAQYDSITNKLTVDSIRSTKHIPDTVHIGWFEGDKQDSATFTGTSITQGIGASDIAHTYTNIVAKQLRVVEINSGAPGNVLQHSPGFPNSNTFKDSYTTIIYPKRPGDKYLFFAWGENDISWDGTYNVDTAYFKRDYVIIINYALSIGWALGDMKIISPFYQTSAPLLTQHNYVDAAKHVADSMGIQFINVYDDGEALSKALLWDNIHPSDRGHAHHANTIINEMVQPLQIKTGENLVNAGTTVLNTVYFFGKDTTTTIPYLMGVTADGRLARVESDKYLVLDGNDIAANQGNATVTGNVSANHGVRAGGTNNFTTGFGLEMAYIYPHGYLTPANRDSNITGNIIMPQSKLVVGNVNPVNPYVHLWVDGGASAKGLYSTGPYIRYDTDIGATTLNLLVSGDSVGHIETYGPTGFKPLSINPIGGRPTIFSSYTDNGSGAKVQVAGKLSVATHDITSNSDSAVVRDPVTGLYSYAKINSGGSAAMTIGASVTGGTNGSVLIVDGGNLAQDNANLFFNNTSNFLGLGNNSPLDRLHVTGNIRFDNGSQSSTIINRAGFMDIQQNDANAYNIMELIPKQASTNSYFITSNDPANIITSPGSRIFFGQDADGTNRLTYESNNFSLFSGTHPGTERVRFTSGGEVNIGNFTDQGSYTIQNTGGLYQNGAVKMDLGSDANYDTYFRNSSGAITRLPAGTDGNVLTTHSTSSAPTWSPVVTSLNSQAGAVTITAGTGITTSTLSGDITVAVDVNNSVLPHTIATYFTDAANSGTSETDLYSTTTAANTLSSNGQTLYFDYTVNVTDITSTVALVVYFAGTSIGNTGALTVSSTGAWRVVGSITRATSTTARATVAVNSPGASTASYTNETDLTSQNFATTNVVKITGQAGGAGGGSGDITAKMGKLYYQP